MVKPLALTLGEPAGIGLELALMLWSERKATPLPTFALLGDPPLVASRAKRLNLDLAVAEVDFAQVNSKFADFFPVVPLGAPLTDTPGKIVKETAHAVLASIEEAVTAVVKGDAAALVTNPVHKKALYDSGFEHPGHTEYLGALAQQYFPLKQPAIPVMMLAGSELRTVPVTIHIPIADVPSKLTQEKIERVIKITHSDLKRRFACANPRIAVTGLNPHAGEQGDMGTEDDAIIRPAIESLKKAGLDVSGPHPADTLFHKRERQNYDAAVAMYHDQALIPIKTIAFDEAANVTLGLPFIRTSPDHGTALELAGTGKARPHSLMTALKMAEAMVTCEKTYLENEGSAHGAN